MKICFVWRYGYGISRETLSGSDVAYAIMDALKTVKETGETAAKALRKWSN